MKHQFLGLRLTDEEHKKLQSLSAADGLSQSEFVRRAIFGRKAILNRKSQDATARNFSIDVVGVRIDEMTERLTQRMIHLEELLDGLTKKTDRAESASVAAVISAALLRDDGSVEDNDLTAKVIAGHIDQAFIAVPSVLSKRARSR